MPQIPRVYKTAAIVLRQRRLGDADKILILYSAEQGKIEAVAKGVRKTKSRLAGHVEPLTQATFLLAKGKTLDIVTQVETIEPFQAVRDDLERLSRGLYAAEMLEKFTETHEEHFALYRLLLDTLRRLATRHGPRHADSLLRDVAAQRAGLPARTRGVRDVPRAPDAGAELLECRRGRRRLPRLSARGGGGATAVGERREAAAAAPARALAEVSRVSIDAPLADELERAMREYVRWVLERDVRSSAFIDDVRRRRPARVEARG